MSPQDKAAEALRLAERLDRLVIIDEVGSNNPMAHEAALIAACHPEALRALLEERKAMRKLLSRAAGEIAGLRNELGCVVGGSIESTDVEHAIKAALTTTADNQEPPKGQ